MVGRFISLLILRVLLCCWCLLIMLFVVVCCDCGFLIVLVWLFSCDTFWCLCFSGVMLVWFLLGCLFLGLDWYCCYGY